jgi:hypothetical protein
MKCIFGHWTLCSILDKEINQKDPMDSKYMKDLKGDANLPDAMLHHI